MDDRFYNRVGGECISSRQIYELVGLACGVAANGTPNRTEAEILTKMACRQRGCQRTFNGSGAV